MFDSVKNWLGRKDRHQAEVAKLENEAKDFRLPSETLPQIFKYLFFVGLGFLNYRLFSHAVPGLWGQATGLVAVMAEAIALYAAHNFSRSAGLFRLCLGASGFVLMAFSLVHGTFSILDLIGAADVSQAVQYYSRLVAFPLLVRAARRVGRGHHNDAPEKPDPAQTGDGAYVHCHGTREGRLRA